MRTAMMCLAFATTTSAGCLRHIEFKCNTDTECGAGAVCEAVGYCSFPDANCGASGRRFSSMASQDLADKCVGASPGSDAGIDAPMIDGMMNVGCPAPYATVGGTPHLYKRLTNVSWDAVVITCKQSGTLAYLAIPDDATELTNMAAVAMNMPFWVGLDDQAQAGSFVTQKGNAATFLPWANGQPDTSLQRDCVKAINTTQIATEKCNVTQPTAVCECEP